MLTPFAAGLSFLMGIAELLKRKRDLNNLRLSGMYMSLSGFMLHDILRYTGNYQSYPILFALTLPFVYLIGPLFYSTVKSQIDPAPISPMRNLIDVAPAILVTVAVILIHPEFTNLKIPGPEFKPGTILMRLLTLPGLCLLVMNGGMMAYRLKKAFRLEQLQNDFSLRWLLVIWIVSIPASLLAIYAYQDQYLSLMDPVIVYTSVIIVAWFLFQERYPDFMLNLQQASAPTKYLVSQLKGVDIAAVREKFYSLFETEKIYRDETISLASLAQILGLTSHQLSEFLNLHIGKNFFALLNEYRIREAQELLSRQPDHTIIRIAFDVGFGSKSAFNAAFRRHIGMTPTEYREKSGPAL